jgi:hypothetical protein
MKRILIGICGPKRSGKDTTAKYISEYGLKHYAFAWPLKRMLAAIGVPFEIWETDEKETTKFYGRTARYLGQTLGTEWGRDKVSDNLWLQIADKEWTEAPANGMVISDVRFENEAAWIRNNGGTIVHVERPGVTWNHSHSSEAGIFREPDDRMIYNDGSIEQLHAQIRFLMRALQN